MTPRNLVDGYQSLEVVSAILFRTENKTHADEGNSMF